MRVLIMKPLGISLDYTRLESCLWRRPVAPTVGAVPLYLCLVPRQHRVRYDVCVVCWLDACAAAWLGDCRLWLM